MSRRFKVVLHNDAHAYVTVTLSDEDIARCAENLGVKPGDLTLDDLRETVEDAAHDKAPIICAQCSGWGQDDVSLDLGDEWNVSDEPEYPDTSWVASTVHAYFARVLPSVSGQHAQPLVDELHRAAADHAVKIAAAFPAVEEVTDRTE